METLLPPKTIDPKSVFDELVSLFIICFIGNMFTGVVSTLMSVYLPVVVKDLQGGQTDAEFNDMSGFINSMFIF